MARTPAWLDPDWVLHPTPSGRSTMRAAVEDLLAPLGPTHLDVTVSGNHGLKSELEIAWTGDPTITRVARLLAPGLDLTDPGSFIYWEIPVTDDIGLTVELIRHLPTALVLACADHALRAGTRPGNVWGSHGWLDIAVADIDPARAQMWESTYTRWVADHPASALLPREIHQQLAGHVDTLARSLA